MAEEIWEVCITNVHLDMVKKVMTRLYSEDRFKHGDEMRDYAQILQAVIDQSWRYDE